MPFKSQAQRRFMYAAEARGEVPKGTADRWQRETGDKKLPEKKMEKSAAFRAGFMSKIADTALKDALEMREDSRIGHLRELAKMSPEERKRYLADMAAKNHRLAMSRPK